MQLRRRRLTPALLSRPPHPLPQEICDLTLECLSLEPQNRPTAQQLLRRLEMNRHSLSEEPPTLPAAVRLSRGA